MPVNRSIGKYNHEKGKVEWLDEDELRPSVPDSPAVYGPLDFRAVGLPGQPHITSRNQYKRLLKQHNCQVVGNEKCSRAPTHQDLVSRDPKKHTRRTR